MIDHKRVICNDCKKEFITKLNTKTLCNKCMEKRGKILTGRKSTDKLKKKMGK